MDINFHYFAVKTIARKAGFEEEDAQLIAAYSQFVDDYNIWSNYTMRIVPEYARSLVTEHWYGYEFYTVTTGFTGYLDTARLALEKYQKEVVIPYHFIPWVPLRNIDSNDRTLFRTQAADINGGSLIATLLKNAKRAYMEETNESEKRYDLMRIGVMLHIFADTYAHQRFSGFHGWENFCYITELKDSVTDLPVKDESSPDFYEKVYSVGHANAGHAPDMTYACFGMSFAENAEQNDHTKYTGMYTRSNTQVFADAAKQIYTLLYQLKHENSNPSEENWQELLNSLKRGFAIQSTKESDLSIEWHRICSDITYHYNKDDLWSSQLVPYFGEEAEKITREIANQEKAEDLKTVDNVLNIYKTASDDFFHFNLIAKEIRDAVLN